MSTHPRRIVSSNPRATPPQRLRHGRKLLAPVIATALAAALAGGAGMALAASDKPVAKTVPAVTSVLIVVPTKVEADPNFGNGCWVRLYDGVGYQGEQLTLMGPIQLPHMTRTGVPWRDWDSAVVGPKARVTVYEGDDFSERSASLQPMQRVADMSIEGFGMFGDINSARVSCTS